jgi:hypothetical protein
MTLKKLILFSVLTVLVGVGVVYALGVFTNEVKFKNSISIQTLPTAKGVDEQDGLELTMTLQKTEYSLGELINITLTITNISNRTINFTLAPSYWDFLVYNDTNNDIYQWLSSRVSPLWVMNVPLDAGAGLTNVLVWPQTCNATVVSEGVPVSPGTYYIVGRYGFQTTPIQVTIVKP